ncbi:unnamed protein product [Cuscuta epithymum]|uniref:DUF4283 domain-containing protein n=1 Tax=Cuscuta epithymum TaxID=186058 RepID=A0AAV0DMK7_9ASTE|nr:unnamed protein product [Cuscuta epithymum]CAH9142045.1 unnamed protein product [Cuscuta epithymum]
MTKNNKKNRTPPPKDSTFDARIKLLNEKKKELEEKKKMGVQGGVPYIPKIAPSLTINPPHSKVESSKEISLVKPMTSSSEEVDIVSQKKKGLVEDDSVTLGSSDTYSEASHDATSKEDKVEKKEWANLFQNNRSISHGMKLEYIPPKGDIVDFSNRKVPSIIDIWGYCLVGIFSGRFPGFKAVLELIKKWGVPCKLKQHDKGWIIFQFKNEEDRTKIISGGPYSSYGKALFLKVLSDDFEVDDEEFLKVPIWVKLPGLSVTLWNKEEISELASRVGVPIVADQVTLNKTRPNFARVLVEVDLSKPPVLQIPMIQPSGKKRTQFVKYEAYPNYCYECKSYGHDPFICKVLHPELKEMDKEEVTTSKDTPREKEKPKMITYVEPEEPLFKLVLPKKNKNVVSSLTTKNPAATMPKQPAAPFVPKKNPGKEVIWRGRRIESVHQMYPDDIVVDFVTEKDGARVVFVKKRHQIKGNPPIAKLDVHTLEEAQEDSPAISFTDSCLVALPDVKRAKKWYEFNKEIFIPNIVSFFDFEASHNLEYAQEMARALEGEAKISAERQAKARAAAQRRDPVYVRKKPYKDWGERLVHSVYELDDEDVITSMEFDEDGHRTVYAGKREMLPFSMPIYRVGSDFKKAKLEDPGMTFTLDCLRELPGVKRKGSWYSFDTSLFIPKVVAFFDDDSEENMAARARIEEEKRKGKGEEEEVEPEVDRTSNHDVSND